MLHPTEWPIWHDEPWENRQPRGGVAPLRHDIALARYLEKQRAGRESTVRSFELPTTAVRACVRMANAGRDFLGRLVAPIGAAEKLERLSPSITQSPSGNDRLD